MSSHVAQALSGFFSTTRGGEGGRPIPAPTIVRDRRTQSDTRYCPQIEMGRYSPETSPRSFSAGGPEQELLPEDTTRRRRRRRKTRVRRFAGRRRRFSGAEGGRGARRADRRRTTDVTTGFVLWTEGRLFRTVRGPGRTYKYDERRINGNGWRYCAKQFPPGRGF